MALNTNSTPNSLFDSLQGSQIITAPLSSQKEELTTVIKLTPKQYLAIKYPYINYCTKTVINWIKKGKLKGEQNPGGGWVVLFEPESNNKANELLLMLEASGEN